MSNEKKQGSLAPAFLALLEQDSQKQGALPCSKPDLNESGAKRSLGQEFYDLVTSVKVRNRPDQAQQDDHKARKGGSNT